MNNPDYKQIAKEARLKVLEMVYRAKSSHIGSNFSVIDILTVLFEKHDKHNDSIVLSCGWKAAAFYYFLARRGDFPMEWLDTYNQEGSKLIGLTEPGVPGVLFAGGSMQMGLPAAVGFALSKKLKNEPGKVYCIMSDGEMAGGMIYESILIAIQHQLNNLCILIDKNGLQAMGKTEDIVTTNWITDAFRKLGVNTVELDDGHDHEAIERTFTKTFQLREIVAFEKKDMPWMMVYETTKGKGVSFMENNNLYHYKDLSLQEYNGAIEELIS